MCETSFADHAKENSALLEVLVRLRDDPVHVHAGLHEQLPGLGLARRRLPALLRDRKDARRAYAHAAAEGEADDHEPAFLKGRDRNGRFEPRLDRSLQLLHEPPVLHPRQGRGERRGRIHRIMPVLVHLKAHKLAATPDADLAHAPKVLAERRERAHGTPVLEEVGPGQALERRGKVDRFKAAQQHAQRELPLELALGVAVDDGNDFFGLRVGKFDLFAAVARPHRVGADDKDKVLAVLDCARDFRPPAGGDLQLKHVDPTREARALERLPQPVLHEVAVHVRPADENGLGLANLVLQGAQGVYLPLRQRSGVRHARSNRRVELRNRTHGPPTNDCRAHEATHAVRERAKERVELLCACFAREDAPLHLVEEQSETRVRKLCVAHDGDDRHLRLQRVLNDLKVVFAHVRHNKQRRIARCEHLHDATHALQNLPLGRLSATRAVRRRGRSRQEIGIDAHDTRLDLHACRISSVGRVRAQRGRHSRRNKAVATRRVENGDDARLIVRGTRHHAPGRGDGHALHILLSNRLHVDAVVASLSERGKNRVAHEVHLVSVRTPRLRDKCCTHALALTTREGLARALRQLSPHPHVLCVD
eukprot:Opistho-1_new@104173